MAQNVDMTKLEAQLSRLEGLSGHITQLLQSGAGEPSAESITDDLLYELNDFSTNIKQATTQLRSYSQRWRDATVVKSEDVKRLERREEKIELEEDLLRQKQADMAEQEELLKQKTAEMTLREELLKLKASGITMREELLEQKTRAMNERDARMAEKSSKLSERETLIESKSLELKESIKDHFAGQAVDTDPTRLLDHQFASISAKLANISEVCTGLLTNVSDISTGLTAKVSDVSTGLNTLSTKFREMQIAESNATDRMTGAAEELQNATETGSKAREALQQVLVRSNATIFNNNTAKRGAGLSSPEKPATNRRRPRHVRGSSAGAAEVLAGVEAPELLVNTIQTFGSPSERRIPLFDTPRTASGGFGRLAPFAGHLTVSRSGASSSAVNPVSSSPGTIIPSSQSDPSDLSVASDHVQNVWRQIEFPANWTTADSAKLLVALNEAKEHKGGRHNRYWPQQAIDAGSVVTQPYCLTKDLKSLGMQACQDGQPCESHPPGTLCIDVFYTSDSPGEYDSAATDKRWRLEIRR